MKIQIARHDFTIIWEGVYYFALSDYPNISSWELKKIVSFIEYERQHGRKTEIECDDKAIMEKVHYVIHNPQSLDTENIVVPQKLTECTYCNQKGCLTEFVCHTATIYNAKKILTCGKLLSAEKAFHKSGEEFVSNSRNAAGDPADYFEYIMFSHGNCQAGDRLVMERDLGRSPTDDELNHHFKPGVRFYFRYNDILKHPDYVFDGYHIAKIKDELVLNDYLYACIIPKEQEKEFISLIPSNLDGRTYYLSQNKLGLLNWSERVFDFICKL